MTDVQLVLIFVGGIISLAVLLAALFRISDSHLTDGVKLGWVITVLLLPILGSVSALIVIEKQLVEQIK